MSAVLNINELFLTVIHPNWQSAVTTEKRAEPVLVEVVC